MWICSISQDSELDVYKRQCYETAAEIRAFAGMGADAVGMSTVPETMVCNYTVSYTHLDVYKRQTLTCIGFRPLPDEIAHQISHKFHLY